MRFVKAGALAIAALSAFGRVDAQVANTSTAALGMGENYTAVARGYNAVAWNPAALGLSGNAETSAMIGGLFIHGGVGPIKPSELGHFADEVVPLSVKERWLSDIRNRGGQAGAAGFDMTWATVQTGRFALQASSSARALNDISPDFAELLLFGNIDEQGNAKNLDLSGSDIDVAVHSTLALSFGLPIVLQRGVSRLALGVTAKHTIGHVLAVSELSTGETTSDPVAVRFSFPVAYTPVVKDDGGHRLKSGSGFGADVAVAYENRNLVVSAVAQNVVNSFAWEERFLYYRPAELILSDSGAESRFAREPLATAPGALRARVAALQFRPSYAVGAMLRSSSHLTLAADARVGSTDGMSTRAPVHAGAGAEFRPLQWLPLQVGAAYVRTDSANAGVQLSGGLGLQLGGFLVSVSGARRTIRQEPENMLMIGLLSHSFYGVRRPPVARTNNP